MLDFAGRLSVHYTLHTVYNKYCTPGSTYTAHLVQYKWYTLYNRHCTPCTIDNAHLVQLDLAGRLSELGS